MYSRNPPKSMLDFFTSADRTAGDLLETGRFHEARAIYESELHVLRYFQESDNRRYHKGAPLYNIGLSLLLERKMDGIHFLLLAHIEDLITSTQEGTDPKSNMSFQLLTKLHFPARKLQSLEDYTRKLAIGISRILEPEEVLQRAGLQDVVAGLSALNAEDRETLKSFLPSVARKDPSKKLVFIGGSFKTIAILRHFRTYVDNKQGYEAVLLDRILPEALAILAYPLCTGALDDCDYAIFEVTIPEGQLAEIVHHYEINKTRPGIANLLLLIQRVDNQPHIHSMIPGAYWSLCKDYRMMRDASRHIKKFLP